MPKRSDLKLTKRTVDALKADGKDALFWDRELAGFGVRVHATGRKTYVVQSRGPGGPKRVTLGRHGKLAVDEARKQAALIIDRIKCGEDISAAAPEAETTLAGLAERFMRTHVEKHLKPASVAAYRTVLEGHILPALGGMGLEEVGGGGSHGAPSRPSRYAGPGEPGGPSPLAHVRACRGVGAGPARAEPLPRRAPLQDAGARAVFDA